jgi:hypothetical protein
MACKNKSFKNKKRFLFTLTEFDVVTSLMELSNSDEKTHSSTLLSDENHQSNSSNSVTMQSKPQQSQSSDDISSSSLSVPVEDTLAEVEDEGLKRKKTRLRSIEELYRATKPIVIVPPFDKNEVTFTIDLC